MSDSKPSDFVIRTTGWIPTKKAQDAFVALDQVSGLDRGLATVHTVSSGQYFRAASLGNKNRNKKESGIIYLSISGDFEYGGIGKVVLAQKVRKRPAKVKHFSRVSTVPEIELEKRRQMIVNEREKSFDVITPGGHHASSEKVLLRDIVQVFENEEQMRERLWK